MTVLVLQLLVLLPLLLANWWLVRGNARTILKRELRSRCRRLGTWIWRMGVVLPAYLITLKSLLSSGEGGSETLATIVTWLLPIFCFGAGISVADIIGSERRQGTLGLLFLTPLRPAEILLGKAACQAVQYLLCLLATVPIFALPVLVGGVSWQEVIAQCANLLVATLLGISAGLLSTILFRHAWGSLGCCMLLLLVCHLGPFIHQESARLGIPGPNRSLRANLLELPSLASASPFAIGANRPVPPGLAGTGMPAVPPPPPGWPAPPGFAGTGMPAAPPPFNPLASQFWWGAVLRILGTAAALFFLALWIFLWQRARERNPVRLHASKARPPQKEPDPVDSWIYPTIRRRRLRLPDGCNPCLALNRAFGQNPLLNRMVLMLLAGIFLLFILASINDPRLDSTCFFLVFLLEGAVCWSLSTEIPRQYSHERNGGTLELVLGSAQGSREVSRGLDRATIRTHLWKPAMLAVSHLLMLFLASYRAYREHDFSLLALHSSYVPLVFVKARALHMVGASLTLRGRKPAAVAALLLGIFFLLPLAAHFFLSDLVYRKLPDSLAILIFLVLLPLFMALAGLCFTLDHIKLHRFFREPDFARRSFLRRWLSRG